MNAMCNSTFAQGLRFFHRTFVFLGLLFVQVACMAQELCANGIDDDGDGLIDLNDSTECSCDNSALLSPLSLIPNPSFEAFTNCPFGPTQIDQATSWTNGTNTTAEYQNTCGFIAQAAVTQGLMPFPDGNGAAGIIASTNWKEYIKACLASPVIAGTEYQLVFYVASTPIQDNDVNLSSCGNGSIYYGPLDLTLFGSAICDPPPLLTEGCPTALSPLWVELGSVNYIPGTVWSQLVITFAPTVNISSIMLGPPCVVTADFGSVNSCYPYFFLDDLQLLPSVLPAAPVVSLLSNGDACTEDLVLFAQPVPIDPGTYTYQWYQNGIALVGGTSATLSIPAGTAGLGAYELYMLDGPLCALSDPWSVNTASFDVEAENGTICNGESIDLIASGASTYLWNNGSTNAFTTVAPLVSTTYQLVGFANGCTDTIDVEVVVEPAPQLWVSDDVSIALGTGTPLIATVADGSLLWSPAEGLSCTACDSTFAQPAFTTTYCVEAQLGACSEELCVVVDVYDPDAEIWEALAYMPNAFTPNDDGINDVWRPLIGNWKTADIAVFDRWGARIYASDNADAAWSGVSSSGALVPDGVYPYLLRLRFINGSVRELRGHITLLR